VIFRVPPALGALGVLHPPDPSVLLVVILGGVRYGLVSQDVHELLVAVLGGPARRPHALQREPM
jgi:hypothetical protein